MNLNNITGINSENITNLTQAQKTNLESDSFKQSLDSAIQNGEDEKLKEACAEFESYFLNMMFKSMRQTVLADKDGIFAKSNAEQIFQDMLDQELTTKMAKQGGIGLADMMYKQLDKKGKTIDLEA